ncbi:MULTISPECIES: alpha/beta hydrolase [unclassified Duganella]|uniref:alpha/beta hydrolase n=1 Tax=unclassified Duganella TaxID=2636909 RepID=UPI000E3420E2|nr:MULTISPECIES: alpha/beta fold hydrolase [unclassified Duganella]RFP18343.1 alpha/beta hydrolase [Duganella sp. BJB475]RFP35008.1 alpha/beta hydrolase [Duganella sp. BJB476]
MRFKLLLSLLMLSVSVHAAQRPVSLDVGGGTLYGTELLPDGGGKFPVVLLHAGSGPTDRDGNSRLLPGPNDSLRMVAEALAQRGIASVRYDKRAIGASALPVWKEQDLRLDDYIDDATAWLRKLRADPRFSRVVMAGHSEGAQIAAEACRQAATDACVLIAGAGHPLDDILRDQLKGKLPPELEAQSERILVALKQGKTVDDVPQALMMLYHPSVQPYLISSLKHDPRAAIAALTMPVLILQGTSDIQVQVSEAQALAAAAPRARLVVVEGMNHLLKIVGDDEAKQKKSYGSPEFPVAPQLIDALSTFVKAPPAGK